MRRIESANAAVERTRSVAVDDATGPLVGAGYRASRARAGGRHRGDDVVKDPLQLPIDSSVGIHASSYKNPARVRVASLGFDLVGWHVYFWLGGYSWRIGTMRRYGSDGGHAALVFGTGARNKRRGINHHLAALSGAAFTEFEIHDADHYGVILVAPDESRRSRFWWVPNDAYVPDPAGDQNRPWKLGARGWPKKRAPSRFADATVLDFPPGHGSFPPPSPPEPPPPEPPVSNEPDIEPTPAQIRTPDAFSDWLAYPETLGLGGPMHIVVSTDEIRGRWPRHLGDLPRYQSGDRFGRLCWVLWVGDEYVIAHGEHLRIQGGVDEGNEAAIHPWTGDGMDLGETLAAKSKDSRVQATGIDITRIKRIGLCVVTHDQNPNPQRSPITWWGAPFVQEPEPPAPPPPPEPPSPTGDPIADWVAELDEFLADWKQRRPIP